MSSLAAEKVAKPKYHSQWYEANRERLLPIRREYNKKYSARPEVIYIVCI